MKTDTMILPGLPNARSPMSGYVLMVRSAFIHFVMSKDVQKAVAARSKRSERLNHPPRASEYGTDSIPIPNSIQTIIISNTNYYVMSKYVNAWKLKKLINLKEH